MFLLKLEAVLRGIKGIVRLMKKMVGMNLRAHSNTVADLDFSYPVPLHSICTET